MKITIEITSQIALEALVESLGWSTGAVAKRLDNGSAAMRTINLERFEALADLQDQLHAGRKNHILNAPQIGDVR